MPSKSEFITWAIERYQSSGGSGVASVSASSVTASKVQIRNDEGDLLKEYDKDFAEYKMGSTTNESASRETPKATQGQNGNNELTKKDDYKNEPTPMGARPNLPLALVGLVALVGIIAIAASNTGVSTTSTTAPDSPGAMSQEELSSESQSGLNPETSQGANESSHAPSDPYEEVIDGATVYQYCENGQKFNTLVGSNEGAKGFGAILDGRSLLHPDKLPYKDLQRLKDMMRGYCPDSLYLR